MCKNVEKFKHVLSSSEEGNRLGNGAYISLNTALSNKMATKTCGQIKLSKAFAKKRII